MFSFAVPTVEKQSGLINMPVQVRECYSVSPVGSCSERNGKLILEILHQKMCNHMDFYTLSPCNGSMKSLTSGADILKPHCTCVAIFHFT